MLDHQSSKKNKTTCISHHYNKKNSWRCDTPTTPQELKKVGCITGPLILEGFPCIIQPGHGEHLAEALPPYCLDQRGGLPQML